MKNLKNIVVVSTLVSLTSCIVPEKAVQVSESISIGNSSSSFAGPTSNSRRDKFDPINSKYTERDFAGCFTAALLAPIAKVGEAFLNKITGKEDVDIHFSEKTITLVEKNLKKFVQVNGKITPDDFWMSLDQEAFNGIVFDVLANKYFMDSETFEEKKKVIAYAFLYYLEVGEANTSYSFTFDDRRDSTSKTMIEYISFAGSKKIKDTKEVGVCGYFRFTEIETKHRDELHKNPTILCSNKNGTKIEISKNELNELKLKVSAKYNRSLVMDYNDIDVSDKNTVTKLEYNLRWLKFPKVYIDIKKESFINENGKKEYRDNSSERVDLFIKHNLTKRDAFKNLNCKTIQSFEF